MYRPKDVESVSNSRLRADDAATQPRGSLLDELDAALAGRREGRPTPAPAPAYSPAAAEAATASASAGPSDGSAALKASIDAQIASLTRIGPVDVLIWLRRGIIWIVLATLLGIGAAFGYSVIAKPRWTVHTDMLLDPQNLNVVNDDVFATNPMHDSQIMGVESRLRVLASRNVLSKVIADLNLVDEPEFNRPGLLDPLLSLIPGESGGDENREIAVLRQLTQRVSVRREERSYVAVLSVWAETPENAMRISEAIVSSFEAELFNAAASSAGRIAATLTSRLDELRTAVTEAEEQVEQFRREKNIQSSVTGELASSRISSALDTQVLEAQQRLIQLESRYASMQAAIADRRTATASVFDSPSMETLRASYNTLRQEIGSLGRALGQRHPRLVSLQSELASVEQAIADEAARIHETARTETAEARATLAGLRSRADSERSNVFANNDDQIRLRELEREARAKAAVYESYLARSHQIAERQQIDTSNLRVISPPVPPKSKTWPPRRLILLAGGAAGGFALGTGLAILFGLSGHLAEARRRQGAIAAGA